MLLTKIADLNTLIINFSTYVWFYDIPIASRQFEYQQLKTDISKKEIFSQRIEVLVCHESHEIHATPTELNATPLVLPYFMVRKRVIELWDS